MADRALNAISPSLFHRSGSRTFINIVTSDSEVCCFRGARCCLGCKWWPEAVSGTGGQAAWGCLRGAGYRWLVEGVMWTPPKDTLEGLWPVGGLHCHTDTPDGSAPNH